MIDVLEDWKEIQSSVEELRLRRNTMKLDLYVVSLKHLTLQMLSEAARRACTVDNSEATACHHWCHKNLDPVLLGDFEEVLEQMKLTLYGVQRFSNNENMEKAERILDRVLESSGSFIIRHHVSELKNSFDKIK